MILRIGLVPFFDGFGAVDSGLVHLACPSGRVGVASLNNIGERFHLLPEIGVLRELLGGLPIPLLEHFRSGFPCFLREPFHVLCPWAVCALALVGLYAFSITHCCLLHCDLRLWPA